MLKKFSFVDLEITFRFARDVAISAAGAGPMLRGAFGTQLRRIVCHDRRADCRDCLMRQNCAYERLFSPMAAPDAGRLRKERDLPRPFIIKPPLKDGRYGQDAAFTFRMIVVGDRVQWFPYIVVPFSELGRVGVGRERTPYTMERIVSRGIDAAAGREIYTAAENLVRVGDMVEISFADVTTAGREMRPERLSVTFLTPTILRYNESGMPGGSRAMGVPEFHVLIKRLRDRVNRLALAYCGEELAVDHREFGQRAEAVERIAILGRWVERIRRTRTGQAQDLGGFVGRVSFAGQMEEFLPLLLLGQYVHVGKNSVFGGGWYEVGEE